MPTVGVFAAIFDNDERILLTKINYGSGNWTLPGGHLEKNESPIEGVIREVFEETGCIVEVENLICVYSSPLKDDLVLLFKVKLIDQIKWRPNQEIEKLAFFNRNELPTQIHPWNIKRIKDAFNNKFSNIYIFDS
ncbi:NUDIX hydrolase [Bacillus suaedaesalsae]|uniref:NUDIX hydrolase n=1 Tax=Bacillus suaedaesalsae TaxID=2810349 RepID=A0ABS2DH42_9BACI|nr:NUDIX hydrolase [Bacillus suaedaesalsae]MBM6617792.1 NUDIX hydrolase [Bacillus suaedaesalsae]